MNVFAVAKAHFGGIEVLLRDGKWRIQASLTSGGMDLEDNKLAWGVAIKEEFAGGV